VSEREYFFDNPKNLKWGLRIFYLISAGLLLIDVVLHRHVMHEWESLVGFYAIYGFVACVLLVLIAKQLRKVVMRKEDYYKHD